MNWLIREGRLLDPARAIDTTLDVRVRNGRIVEVAPALIPSRQETVVRAQGCLVAPALIDLHVHLRDPGQTHKETIETGTRAAAAGGFRAVVCMANTSPPLDTPERVRYVQREASRVGRADVFPVGTITRGLKGRDPSPYEEMRAAGAIGFSDDGKSVLDAQIMRNVLRMSAEERFPVLVHCEDPTIARDGVMHAGYVADELGLPGIPPEAEERIIARDIALAEETGGRLHVQHVTTRGGVALIRDAKTRGVRVTGEACPHHFTLTHEAVRQQAPNAKMNPPLRTADDVEAVIAGLADGTLDAIATDHAPHTADEKARGMRHAPFGIIGLEFCVPLAWTQLVVRKRLSPLATIAKLTVAPARILGIPEPRIEPGATADLVVIDPSLALEVTPDVILSKSRNTPFFGRRWSGWPILTLRGGDATFQRSQAKERFHGPENRT